MKYIKTCETIFEVVENKSLVFRVRAKKDPDHIYSKSKCSTDVVKCGDTIEDLIDVGDLVKYIDITTKGESFAEISKFFMPHQTGIYRVIELYIKQANGDYNLVAKDKGNYRLELV